MVVQLTGKVRGRRDVVRMVCRREDFAAWLTHRWDEGAPIASMVERIAFQTPMGTGGFHDRVRAAMGAAVRDVDAAIAGVDAWGVG